MAYVKVKEENGEKLHLCREPSFRVWAILFALIFLGLAAAFYSTDYLIWKMAYFSAAVFVGLSCMEDWEDCILDKSTGEITFLKQSLIQKLFQATKGQKVVVANIAEVMSVEVQAEDIKYGSTGYNVVINFSTGYSIGVTEVITTDDRGEHEFIAKKIRTFLKLDSKPLFSPVSEASSNGDEADNFSSNSDDSFEQIDKSELIDSDDNLKKEEEKPDDE